MMKPLACKEVAAQPALVLVEWFRRDPTGGTLFVRTPHEMATPASGDGDATATR
jgi:hypothetical protein